MSTTMSVRLDDDIKDRLVVLAEATRPSKSFLAAEAIRAYVGNNEWQLSESQATLKSRQQRRLRRQEGRHHTRQEVAGECA